MAALHLGQGGDERVVLDRAVLAGNACALEAREVEARELPDLSRREVRERRGETQLGGIKPVIGGIALVATEELVVAVPNVHDGRRVQRVDVIERHLARDEPEPLPRRQVVEVVVVVAVPVVPADAAIHALLVCKVVVDAQRVVPCTGFPQPFPVAGSCRCRRPLRPFSASRSTSSTLSATGFISSRGMMLPGNGSRCTRPLAAVRVVNGL